MPTLTETQFFPVPTRSNYFQIPTHENPRLKKKKKKKKKHDREDKLARMQAKMHASRKSYEPRQSRPGPRTRPRPKRRSHSHSGSGVQFAGQSNFDEQYAANMAEQGGPIEVDDDDDDDFDEASHFAAAENQANENHDVHNQDHQPPQHQPHPDDGPFTRRAKEFGMAALIIAFAQMLDVAVKTPRVVNLFITEVEMTIERFRLNHMLSFLPFTQKDYMKLGLGAFGASLVAKYGAGGTNVIGWEGMLAAYQIGQKLDRMNWFKHYKFFTHLSVGTLIGMNQVVLPFIANPQLRLPMLAAQVAPTVAQAVYENSDAIGEYAADTIDGVEQFTDDMAVGAFEAAQGMAAQTTGGFDILGSAQDAVSSLGQTVGNLAADVAQHEASNFAKSVVGSATGLTLAIAGGAGF